MGDRTKNEGVSKMKKTYKIGDSQGSGPNFTK